MTQPLPQMGWIVIPKGFTGNRLSLTVQAVPASGFAWHEIDWPAYANTLKSVSLQFRPGPAATAREAGRAQGRPLVATGDTGLWRTMFNADARSACQPALAAPARFKGAETCIQAVALDGFAAAAHTAYKQSAKQAKARGGHPASLLLRQPLSAPGAAANGGETIDHAYHRIGRLFHRSDLPLAGTPAGGDARAVVDDKPMPHWQRRALEKNELGIDYSHLNQLRELRGNDGGAGHLGKPIGQLEEADRLSHMNAMTVYEFLDQNSPGPTGRQAAAAPVNPNEHSDTVLAALGHAFPLQQRLGLISDWEIEVADPGMMGEISVALHFGHDDGAPAVIAHTPLWTTIAGGRPAEAASTPGAAAPPLSFRKTGLVEPANALMTTCELRGNLTRTIATIQAVFDRNQVSVRGANPREHATADMPSLRTGPLVLFVEGLAQWRSKFLTPDTGTPPPQPAFTMADLAIGVRPDVRVGPAGGWRKLMARQVSYAIAGAAAEADRQNRAEGFVGLAQFAGEDTALTHDELVSWSGWNPAVPFPGQQAAPEEALFGEHIRAIPHSNPRFRYGDEVAVRLRAVLRDGSSFDAGDADGRAATGIASSLLGSRLLRFEPIAAPELMLSSSSFPHGWTPLPHSAHHVVLSSDPSHSIDCVEGDTRWILPGRLPNIVELDKHGCFDRGLTPRASAFADCDIRRGKVDTDEQSVFVPGRGSADPRAPYHPDPLARRIAVVLVRMHAGGDWVPVTDSGGRPLRIEHDLYGDGRQWPDARALHVTFLASGSGAPLSYGAHADAGSLTVRVPPGESFHLVAYAMGDAGELTRRHAFGSFADEQQDLLVPMLANALRVRVSHFVTKPHRPRLGDVTPRPHRELGASEVVVALDAEATPAGTGSLDVMVRWEDPLDQPGAAPPRIPSGRLQDSPFAQVSLVANLDKELHTAVDDAVASGSNRWMRAPVVVASKAAVRHAFPDGRHRMVEYFAVARSSALMPKPGKALAAARSAPPVDPSSPIWRSASEPVPVCILASRAPAAPVVRDILPAFSFDRVQSFNLTSSRRNPGATVILERGWLDSGPGELLALVMPGADPSVANGMVCGIGADPVLMPAAAMDARPLSAYLAASRHACDLSSPKARGVQDLPPPPGLLLFEPHYDAARQGWRVDLPFKSTLPLPLPFMRLVVARYQPNADQQAAGTDGPLDVRLSPAVAVDFIQLPAQRTAVVIAHTDYPEHVTVKVSGPALSTAGAASLVITATLEQDISTAGASPLFVRVSEPTVLAPERQVAGIGTWGRDVRSNAGPLHGRVRVRIVERAVEGGEHVIEGPVYYFDTVEVARLAPGAIEA
ncbi:MAG: hypothetical protein ACXWC2_14390 [Ramlibacter sp.]